MVLPASVKWIEQKAAKVCIMQCRDNCHSASVLQKKSSPLFLCAMVNLCQTKAAAGNFPRHYVVVGRTQELISGPSSRVFFSLPPSTLTADDSTAQTGRFGQGTHEVKCWKGAWTSQWGAFKQLFLAVNILSFSHFFRETPVKSLLPSLQITNPK